MDILEAIEYHSHLVSNDLQETVEFCKQSYKDYTLMSFIETLNVHVKDFQAYVEQLIYSLNEEEEENNPFIEDCKDYKYFEKLKLALNETDNKD